MGIFILILLRNIFFLDLHDREILMTGVLFSMLPSAEADVIRCPPGCYMSIAYGKLSVH